MNLFSEMASEEQEEEYEALEAIYPEIERYPITEEQPLLIFAINLASEEGDNELRNSFKVRCQALKGQMLCHILSKICTLRETSLDIFYREFHISSSQVARLLSEFIHRYSIQFNQ